MDISSTSAPGPLKRALETIKRLKAQLDMQGATQALAMVGIGLRFPGQIDSLDAYWQALAEGRDLVHVMPAARKAPFAAEWDTLPHNGGFLDDVTSFDAGFFGISPREARALDPQHRLLLEVAWEALENAALPPTDSRPRAPASTSGSPARTTATGRPERPTPTGRPATVIASYQAASPTRWASPGRPSRSTPRARRAWSRFTSRAKRRGECEVAVAGGVNLVLSPRSTRLVKETRALAPDGLCKAFDARANGFTRGEGCARAHAVRGTMEEQGLR
jgi:hypothetical protein